MSQRLAGVRIVLEPLTAAHEAALVRAASDGELWNMTLTVIPGPETVRDYLARALADATAMPYLVTLADGGEPIGSTRFWRIDRANRSLEIGHTWYARRYLGTFVNPEAKYLMLRHAFEAMGCLRVQLVTDALNERSRRAIEWLGAELEGVIRSERIMPDGRRRDSALYSIIEEEWPAVKARLEARLAGASAPPPSDSAAARSSARAATAAPGRSTPLR